MEGPRPPKEELVKISWDAGEALGPPCHIWAKEGERGAAPNCKPTDWICKALSSLDAVAGSPLPKLEQMKGQGDPLATQWVGFSRSFQA